MVIVEAAKRYVATACSAIAQHQHCSAGMQCWTQLCRLRVRVATSESPAPAWRGPRCSAAATSAAGGRQTAEASTSRPGGGTPRRCPWPRALPTQRRKNLLESPASGPVLGWPCIRKPCCPLRVRWPGEASAPWENPPRGGVLARHTARPCGPGRAGLINVERLYCILTILR
jgi:hypothetical protein